MLKRFTRRFLQLLFVVSLALFILLHSVVGVVGDSTAVKQVLANSDLYSNAVDTAFVSLEKEQNDQAANDSPQDININDPAIKQAAKDALPPELLQVSFESVIDGTYSWLEGNSRRPEFVIDLTKAKQDFAANISEYAQQRYSDLPVCTQQQLEALPKDENILNAPCQSPNIDASSAKQKVADFINNDDFLPETIITADTVFDQEGAGQDPFTDGRPQQAYSLINTLPWLFLAITIVSAIALVFLYKTKRMATKRLGASCLGVAITLAALAGVAVFIVSSIAASSGQSDQQEALASIAGSLISSLATTISYKLLLNTLVVGLIGAALMIAAKFYNRPRSTPTINRVK